MRFVILLLVFPLLLLLFTITVISKPPVEEFNSFRQIANSQDFNSSSDKKKQLENARFFREAAYLEWKKQNEKCIINRDYTESKRIILMAISIIEEANKNMNNTSENNISSPVRDQQTPFDMCNFDERATSCYAKWNKWVSEALTYSKEKKTVVVIIDKLNHNCLLIENGIVISDFLIEMGVNYLNDKQMKGDNSTAEGSYFITSKSDSTKTNFYKTIQLNFPNKEDRARFESAYQNRDIPNLDVLKEKLMIHGAGGKGYNWTDGSIALTNEDIDRLYAKVKIGTKVVIIGSNKEIWE